MAEINVEKKSSNFPWWIWLVLALIIIVLLFVFLGDNDDTENRTPNDRDSPATTAEPAAMASVWGNINQNIGEASFEEIIYKSLPPHENKV